MSMQTHEAKASTTSTPRRHGRGTALRVGRMHVLSLEGSDREMGEQHGALLRDEIAGGPIPYFRGHIERMLGRGGPATKLVFPAVKATVGRRIRQSLPSHVVEQVSGIAEGAGLSLDEFIDGCTMPDAFLWVASRMMQLKAPGPAVVHRLSLGIGCTSAVAWGKATPDGKLRHARNFDYHGVGCWTQNPAVIFYAPERAQRYVSVASAGVGLGGITAMNEAGLSLTVHQHMFTDRVRLGGLPIGVAGDRVMREAESLDDAAKILREQRPISCWTYVVTDGKRREVLCHEENPEKSAQRRVSGDPGLFAYSNIYLDRDLGETEIDMYGSYWRHNEARYRRAQRGLEQRQGGLDAQAIAEVLADAGHERCRLSEAISMVMTVASVVFEPEDGRVWVGSGDAPTSEGTFLPFDLRGARLDAAAGSFSTARSRSGSSRQAFERFRRAYIAYLDDQDTRRARDEMRAACELAPDEALYHALVGLTSIELCDGQVALDAFDRALALGHPHEQRLAAFWLWRGRALDLLGRTADARQSYARALSLRADAPVHQAARKNHARPFAEGAARRVSIDFAMADVVQP